ncbi:hypothetical protein BHM03_00029791 [Ensete ventricosum]|nr:hypothetical protein BHM03_00029791 [Ensete ventricosum]
MASQRDSRQLHRTQKLFFFLNYDGYQITVERYNNHKGAVNARKGHDGHVRIRLVFRSVHREWLFSVVLEEKPSEEKVVVEQNTEEDGKVEISPKSSLKKPRASDSEQVHKRNVKWMDLLGKELLEIREFETM